MPDFDDPFKPPGDATVLRPRPGAGRRAGEPGPAPAARPSSPSPQADAAPIASMDALGIGLNPLVQAASPLLLLAGQLRGTLSGPDVPGLRRHALDEIRRFEDRARAGGVQNEVVLAARYALCAGLDEAVLSTPWGAQSEWAQQTLLVALHREAWGGEKFFEMLDRISPDPKRHIDLMELLYLCLAFGFMGKYQVADRGHSRLSDVQHELYRRIREYRGQPPTELSLRWKGLEDRRNPLIKYVPWWVVGAAAILILAIAYTTFSSMLAGASEPVLVALDKLRSAPPPAAAPASGPTLKQLLDNAGLKDAIAVVENQGETRVTLLVPNLFESASATVNAAHLPVLQRIAAELKKVPGRIQVVGHTDDQPVYSARFANNYELSRQRAASVVVVINEVVANPGRIEAVGRGSLQPIAGPETPNYRARNRRVEIIHRAGS